MPTISFTRISPKKNLEKEMTMMAMANISRLKEKVRKKAEIFRDSVKQYIKTQQGAGINWIPLSSKWLAEKKRQGWDLGILIATGKYLNSIVVKEGVNEFLITVEDIDHVMKFSNGRTKSISMKSLAWFLEYGTGKMWGRPHWTPAWAKFVHKYARIIRL